MIATSILIDVEIIEMSHFKDFPEIQPNRITDRESTHNNSNFINYCSLIIIGIVSINSQLYMHVYTNYKYIHA